MAEKLKSLTLTKAKLADIDGEHRVTFIASSPNEDRDYERVNIGTYRLPLKGGGHIKVSDLPIDGETNVDIPLLLDHDLYQVEKVIGSVRRAFYANGNLVFEAGLSSRPLAQEMFTLLEEGHLDNAFSIQYRDFNHDIATNTDSDGEIIEVSLVTRGSNMDAQVLAVKSLQGETVENPDTTPEDKNDVQTAEEAVENEVVEEVKEAETEVEETEVEEAKEDTSEAEATEETKAEEEAEVTEPQTENTNINEENAMENVAKTLVAEKADQNVTAKSANADYLKSKTAVRDYANLITNMKGASSEAVAKAWKQNLEAKGISGDAIMPSRIENIFFKGWDDENSILSTFRIIRSRASSMNALLGTGEGIRAKGHKKGEAKQDQSLELVRRDLKQKVVYKKLPIDLQDILDDETGELLAFRSEELSDRVLTAIAEGAVPGDGRTTGTPDLRIFDGSRGLFSMVADLNVAATPLDDDPTQNEKYAHAVATVIANDNGDNTYDKIIKTLKFVKDKGYGKAVVVPFGTISDLKLEKLSNGNYLFQPGNSPEAAIEARVFEMDEMAGCGYDVIAYAINAYGAYISNEMVRFDYDTTYNQDIMLVERAVAGSLYGNMACAGYASATTSA